jgi:hypothetical protein
MPSLAANPKMLKEDRRRRAFTLGQVARRLGISPDEYRELTVKDQPEQVSTISRNRVKPQVTPERPTSPGTRHITVRRAGLEPATG